MRVTNSKNEGSELRNIESIPPVITKNIHMRDRLEHPDFSLWDSGHNPSSDVLFWNHADYWLSCSSVAEIAQLAFAFQTRPFGTLFAAIRFEQIIASFALKE